MKVFLAFLLLMANMVIICILPAETSSSAPVFWGEIAEEELVGECYYRIENEKEETVFITGRIISPGDRFLDEENNLYQVTVVEERTARARLLEKKSFLKVDYAGREQASPVLRKLRFYDFTVGLLHTHNAESYIPSDGTHVVEGKGGVHLVGQTFAADLEDRHLEVLHDESLHLPHDRGAYRRSRSTAVELIEQGADLIFDIHRDAAPREVYSARVEGEWVAQVLLVVGRENPWYKANRALAYELKAIADELYPGLIKGVLEAMGDYNQDISPGFLLLEAGGHQNSQEAAKRGMEMFAQVTAHYLLELGREQEAPPAADQLEVDAGRAAWGMILGLLFFLVAGGLAYRFWHDVDKREAFMQFTGKAWQRAVLFWRSKAYPYLRIMFQRSKELFWKAVDLLLGFILFLLHHLQDFLARFFRR